MTEVGLTTTFDRWSKFSYTNLAECRIGKDTSYGRMFQTSWEEWFPYRTIFWVPSDNFELFCNTFQLRDQRIAVALSSPLDRSRYSQYAYQDLSKHQKSSYPWEWYCFHPKQAKLVAFSKAGRDAFLCGYR